MKKKHFFFHKLVLEIAACMNIASWLTGKKRAHVLILEHSTATNMHYTHTHAYIGVCMYIFITQFYTLDFYLSLVQLKSYPPLKYWMKRKPNKSIKYSGQLQNIPKVLAMFIRIYVCVLCERNTKFQNINNRKSTFAIFSWIFFFLNFGFVNKVAKTSVEYRTHNPEKQIAKWINRIKWNKMNSYAQKKNAQIHHVIVNNKIWKAVHTLSPFEYFCIVQPQRIRCAKRLNETVDAKIRLHVRFNIRQISSWAAPNALHSTCMSAVFSSKHKRATNLDIYRRNELYTT